MIAPGAVAPPIRLDDQFCTPFDLAKYRGVSQVLLLFYPRDFTPTCSHEVPTLNQLAYRFNAEAKTQPVAISTDGRYTHNAWAADNGGIAYPILADENPPGQVSRAYGAYVPEKSVSDRATVLIGRDGTVLYSETVGVDGRRNIDELLSLATRFAQRDPGLQAPFAPPRRYTQRATLFLKSGCHFSTRVFRAAYNLDALRDLDVVEVDKDPAALAEVQRLLPNEPRVPLLASQDGLFVGKDVTPALAARYELTHDRPILRSP